jgi:mannitol/fructose-specific phosphotransferase system IIA component (Ntr-type)
MPHARLKGLPQFCFSLARVAQPVRWLDYSGPPVEIILLFAVPEDEARNYLNLIAGVARLSQNGGLVKQLQSAPDAAGIIQVLQQVPLPVLRTAQPVVPPNVAGAFTVSPINPCR